VDVKGASVQEGQIENESHTRAVFERLMGRYFWLLPEVWMEHVSGKRLRIDYIGRPFCEFQRCLVGFELKGASTEFAGFSQALKQSIDYRHSVIVDKRCRLWKERTPLFIFVYYPVFVNRYYLTSVTERKIYEGWIAGAVRLAGKYNVGLVNTTNRWDGVRLEVSDTPIWDEKRGLRGNGLEFGTARKPGS